MLSHMQSQNIEFLVAVRKQFDPESTQLVDLNRTCTDVFLFAVVFVDASC